MCLYFEEMAICPHPECIYVDNARQNFCEDFSKSEAKLPQIELRHNYVQNEPEKTFKANQVQKKECLEEKHEAKKQKKAAPSLEKKLINQERKQRFQISQLLDSDLKILLNQNVADFIHQLSTQFTQNLKAKNDSDELRLQNLQMKLQSLQRKKNQS